MTKTFLARLTAVAAPFVLAFGLGSAPQPAGAQTQTPAAPQAAASAAAAPAPVALPEKPAAPAAAPAASAATAKVDNPYGIGALWSQSDAVAKAVLAILAIMSMGSWYVIVTKLLEQMRMGRQARAVDSEFWNAGTVQAGTARLAEGSPFRFIADAGMQATQKHDGLRGKVDFADFVDLCIHRATERVQRRLGNGMSLLATVGSTAPFVGLFGTVWGIYHALTAIGVAGQASIDKVAGPVGEALIMTAIGLAVAVPAVLGYNWLLRRNITVMDDVREFSGELHSVILAGSASA
ncbi:biopolymer transport protein ExbB [Variovorax boronicumulans]|uniref:MotA/TolQ/ExbB proton channel family protein n=1 Tax=Variovorax boronicumulans TaxID=436515 RepID=UPI00277FEC11|nr:MotA/TolQ/ExbB proton channel family protein [Variovorax boronicumulans]MDQ0070348.1 biopolymer transport protein ExbB [Variovorax boronicumulans]